VSTTSDVQTTAPSSPNLDAQIEQANATGRTPVVFVHGLWLLPSSWNRWADVFEQAGHPAVQPGWRTIRRPSKKPTRTRRSSRTSLLDRSPIITRR